jgi:S1-C subfamily serine protease
MRIARNISATLLMWFLASQIASAQALSDSPRITPLVKVIQKAELGVVGLFQVNKAGQIGSGSGSIIHPDGFVLTNHHVVPLNQGFALIGSDLPSEQKPIRFAVIGRNPERDIAILKLQAPGPFPAIPLGRSHDLMNGESVVAAGNPGGRGIVFTSGIVSAKSVLAGMPNAFVMTNYQNSRRPHFIQFDAASNGGNSGGPLINLEGDVIGIVSSGIRQEQNVGFAIPADAVHELIPEIVAPELLTRKDLGLTLTDAVDKVEVAAVKKDGAADESGLKAGDQILAINQQSLRHRADWFLVLRSLLATGRKFSIDVKSGDEQRTLQIQPQELSPVSAVAVEETDLKPGLRYEFFKGRYSLVPEFEKLTAESTGAVQNVSLDEIDAAKGDYFALSFKGFLKVRETGLHRLLIASDDGSNVSLHGERIIGNDGNHSHQGAGRLMYLQKGFHPLEISYFQGNGDKSLEISVQQIGEETQPAASEWIWHTP